MTDYPAHADNITHEWQGFTFKLGPYGKERRYWVSQRGGNPMPGACCFKTPDDAKKGIAALLLTRTILNGTKHDAAAEGLVFWNLMELSR